MPKKNQSKKLRVKARVRPKSYPHLEIEESDKHTSLKKLSSSLVGSAGEDSVKIHSKLLSNSRFPIIHRQMIASHINQISGNRYIQKVMLGLQDIRRADKGLVQRNKMKRQFPQVRELKSLGAIQLAPTGKRWKGRGGSKYAPLPWTTDELNRMKSSELKKAKTAKDRKLLDQKYFRGEQVIKHWNNRYGNWKFPLFDLWAQWFQAHMKEFGKFEFYPDKLWRAFLRKRAASASPWKREVAINPFWPEKNKVKYELYKDELESRDPTSVEFYKPYSKFINSTKPHELVEPPKNAQKFLKKSSYTKPMSNKELKVEIKRLRKVLKLDK